MNMRTRKSVGSTTKSTKSAKTIKGAKRRVLPKQGKRISLVPDWNFQRIFSGVIRVSILAGVFAAAVFVWPYVNRPVTEVEFTGATLRTNMPLLRERIAGSIDRGLLTLDIEQVDVELERVDWVYAAEITKVWPQRLVVNIEEEQPVARWGNTGYLAASGEMVVSEPYEDLAQLPHFDVSVASPREALDLFYGLNSAMLTSGIALQELRQSQFGSWSMMMENGSEIVLGKDELMTRIKRVMRAWQRLEPAQLNELETVDARYPNGIAVKYREEIVQQQQHLNGGWKT